MAGPWKEIDIPANTGWSKVPFDWTKWTIHLREQAHSDMNSNSKISRPRWRIGEEVAAELAHLRRLSIHKSWDEFFREIIARKENMPSPSFIKRETLDPKAVQVALDDLRQGLRKIFERLNERSQVEQELVNGLVAEIQNFHQVLRGIKTLLELALQVEPREGRPQKTGGGNADIIRRFIEGK